MGHSVVTDERINKQLNYEGYGLIRCLPAEHDRGPASVPAGPPEHRHLHHCRRSRPHRCQWSHGHHPHRNSRPRRSRRQETGSAQASAGESVDGIFFLLKLLIKSKSNIKVEIKHSKPGKKKKRKKKSPNPKKKKKKKKKK